MKDSIHAAIEKALTSHGIEGVSFVVDYPTDKTTAADYFSNVAFAAAKVVGQAPKQIAEQLAAGLVQFRTLLQSKWLVRGSLIFMSREMSLFLP
jgi:arginyl-tRNA synthetase